VNVLQSRGPFLGAVIPSVQIGTPSAIIPEELDGDTIQWVKRDHSKGEIDRSGEMLIPWWTDPNARLDDRLYQAYKVVENWRTSHGLPFQDQLTFQ
jgi:hypothetical protein